MDSSSPLVITGFNSLSTKKQTTKFSSANFQKMLSPSYIILKIQRLERANSVDLDEVAHYEPSHQDLRCLQIQLLWSLVLKRVKQITDQIIKSLIRLLLQGESDWALVLYMLFH